MKVPRRFQDLFNIDTELRERGEATGGDASQSTGTVLTIVGVVLDASWITLAASVFLSAAGAEQLLAEGFSWTPGLWGLLLVACSLLGLGLTRLRFVRPSLVWPGRRAPLEGESPVGLTPLQVAVLAIPLMLPSLWLGWAVVCVMAPPQWWGYAVLRIATGLAMSALIDMFLVSRVSGLALESTTRSVAYHRFTLATVVVAVSAVGFALGVRYGHATAGALSPLWLLTYLISGLLLLALAPGPQRAGATGSTITDTRERIIYSVLSALVVAVVGVTLAVVVSPEALALVARGLSLLWWLVTRLLLVIALPAGLLVQVLVWLLRRLIHPGAEPEPLELEESAAEWMQNPVAEGTGIVWLQLLLKTLPAIVVLLLAWWLLRRILQARRQRTGTRVQTEVHESTGGLFRWLTRKFAGENAEEPAKPTWPVDQESPDVRRVREVFREFLEEASGVYRPIEPSETARGFHRALRVRFEGASLPVLDELVASYETARYARSVSPADVARAEKTAIAFAEWVEEHEEEEESLPAQARR